MRSKIIVNCNYAYFEVTPELLDALHKSRSYTRDYDYSINKYIYTPSVASPIAEILVVPTIDLEASLSDVNIQNIMEENNLLTRTNELLQKELDTLKSKSNSTELSVS